MQHVKLIEIITDAGDRGEQPGDELTGTSENVCVLTALPPEQAAEWVRH